MSLKFSKTISLNFPLLLLFISYCLVSLGQLQRIQLSHQVAFYAHDVFISFFVLVLIISSGKSLFKFLKKKLATNAAWRWLALFLAWSLLSLIINQLHLGLNYLPWLYWLRLSVYLSAAIVMAYLKTNRKQTQQWFAIFYLLIFALFILLGFVQYLLIPDLRFLSDQGWDVHYFRFAGTLLDPNFLGLIIINGLLVWLFKLAPNDNWRLGGGVILILSLLLTYSRSSYGTFLLITGIYLFLSYRSQITKKIKKSLLILTGIFVILIPFLPKPGGSGVNLVRTETISSRAEVNRSVLESIQAVDLILGRGLFISTINLDVVDKIVHANFPDNLFVFILISAGIPGLILFCKFLYQAFIKLLSSDGLHFLLLAAVLVHSMFNLSLVEPINLLVLLLVLQI